VTAFSPRAVLGMVLAGALSFFALLWFIGQGDTGPGPDNGQAHAASHGLTGFAGLVALLRTQGQDVTVSRSPGQLETEGLLVLTPNAWADGDDIEAIIDKRRYTGPTLLILPKWSAAPLPARLRAKKGWVQLGGADEPGWIKDLEGGLAMSAALTSLARGPAEWQGLGLSGRLPDRSKIMALEDGAWAFLVRDPRGRALVAYADDLGCYPVLEDAAGYPAEKDCDESRWNVTVVFEPDLFNNYGLADRNRAALAAAVVDLAREGQDIPVVFDLTLNGFGAARNLLTLAFQPPFLAATLCLILALLVVGWRAFGRFGPPLAEGRAIGFGKTQLAADAGGLVRRTRRLHLLGPPYATLVMRRMAHALGLRRADPAEIDRAMAVRAPGAPAFSDLAHQMETARGPSATLRAAHALHALERTTAR
jgi:hypothetical protein